MKALFISLILLFTFGAYGQASNSYTCNSMYPYCSEVGLTFFDNLDGVSDVTSAQPGNNYGCLGVSPEPTWLFFEISTPGTLSINLSAMDDIDFVLWGPFSDQTSALNACGNLGQNPTSINGSVVDCSFSSSNNEIANIPNALLDEVYIMVITNSASNGQTIDIYQTSGTASTSCTTTGISELKQNNKKLIHIVDAMGREIQYKPNTMLIYVYSDGTVEKLFRVE